MILNLDHSPAVFLRERFISDTDKLLDIVYLKKSNDLLSKVDEVVTNSKLTVTALTRLEERLEMFH
jgi:hypothetical protein